MMRARHWSIAVLLLLLAGVVLFFAWRHRREHEFDSLIMSAAAKYSVEPALIKAVIWRESRFNPRARGTAGEIGLMQVMDEAAHEWMDHEHLQDVPETALFDAQTNIQAGTFYLGKLLKRYRTADNPVVFALADYNAGRTRVLKWNKGEAATNSAAFLDRMTFPGTRNYIEKILSKRAAYAEQLGIAAHAAGFSSPR